MKVEYRGKVHELPGKQRVRDVLRLLGINPETVLVFREGELVTEDEQVAEEATLRIFDVVSGG